MQGIVKIVLRDQNGQIVKEVEQKNRIFDIPRKIITDVFPLTIQNIGRYTTGEASGSNYYAYNYTWLNKVSGIKDWFRGIRINDERYEEDAQGNIVDEAYKDWKIPQLVGSDNTSLANTNNYRYTYANTNYSSETGGNGTVKHLYYSWQMPPAVDPNNPQKLFDMKSISLAHFDATGRNSGTSWCNNAIAYQGATDAYTDLIWKYGNFYFGANGSLQSLYSSSYTVRGYSTLFKNPSYKWTNNKFNYTRHLTVSNDYNNYCSIYPLYNNEICLLRYPKDVTTNNTNSFVRYVTIIDNQTGEIKRQFSIDQFKDSGRTYYYSNSSISADEANYPSNQYYNIISTPNKNYLIQQAIYIRGYNNGNQKEVKIRIWEIPSTQSAAALPIPCTARKSTDTSVIPGKTYYSYASSYANVPGYLVSEDRIKFTVATNPTGNPSYQYGGYYEIDPGNEGVDGGEINYIEPTGDPDVLQAFITSTNYGLIYQSYPIKNKLIMCNYILTFTDEGVTIINRYINNTSTNIATNLSSDGRYLGRLDIPGLSYGYTDYSGFNYPIYYNTSCINLDEDVEIKEGNTLTIEYTITAN